MGVLFGKPKKSARRQRRILDVLSVSNVLRQGKCLAGTDSGTSSLADRTRGGGHSRTQSHNDHHCTGTPRYGERTNVSQEQWPRPVPEKCPGILTTTTRFGKGTRSGRGFYTPEYTRHFLQYKLNLWMRRTATISNGSLELQEQKSTGVFVRNICLLLAQGQKRDKRILQGHCSSSMTMRKKEPQDNFHRTTFLTCQETRKRLTKTQPETSQGSNSMSSSSKTEAPLETEPDWSSGYTALDVHFEMKPVKHAFQNSCREMYPFVTSAARQGRGEVFERLMSLEGRKTVRSSQTEGDQELCGECRAGKT